MKTNNRTTKFHISTYFLYPEAIQRFCDENALKYAYVLHNLDSTPPHYHIIFTVSHPCSIVMIYNVFNSYFAAYEFQNSQVGPLISKKGAFAYLTHSNSPEKYQYPLSSVISNDFDYFTTESHSKVSKFSPEEMLHDIFILSTRELFLKYGTFYLINIRNFNYLRSRITFEEKIDDKFFFEIIHDKKFDNSQLNFLPNTFKNK